MWFDFTRAREHLYQAPNVVAKEWTGADSPTAEVSLQEPGTHTL